MPVRYDPLLTADLAAELGERHAGRAADALLLDRERRLAGLRFRSGPSLAFVLHPEAGQLVETDQAPGETRLRLRGLRLRDVTAPADERLLVAHLSADGPEGTRHRLVVELLTNQWNLLLLRRAEEEDTGGGQGRWAVRAALWRRRPGDRVLEPGASYRPPAGERRWVRSLPPRDEWAALLGPVEPGARRRVALEQVAWLSAINVDWVLGEAAEEGGSGPLDDARRRYRRLRSGGRRTWLLDRSWGLQPYVGRLDGPAEELPSLLAGMARSLEREGEWARAAGLHGGGKEERRPVETPELAELRTALASRASRLRRRIDALEREAERGADPAELREIGNLLLARLESVPRGVERAQVEGFSGQPREVELDPSLTPSENADRYFEEAARRERAREKIPREIRRAERALRRVEEGRRELEAAEEAPPEENVEELWELAGGRPGDGDTDRGERDLPYRRLRTSGGLELRVGKGARSNEELTFHCSHTEDIWLHARQAPGAHVILRWGKEGENPPRSDLLEAAVVAAVNSKARHSGTVGVDWTRRKYVRSPRKSAPGVVVPRNVETLFVEPDEALVERLQRSTAADP